MRNFILSVAAIATLTFTGCVPGRIHDELKAKYDGCITDRDSLKAQNNSLKTTVNEKTDELAEANKKLTELKRDTTIIGNTLRKVTANYEQLNKTYDLLLQKNKELLEGNERDTKSLTGQLFNAQKDLQDREDKVKKLEKDLDAKQDSLEQIAKSLNELQTILNKKDSTVNALKKIVTDALVGFNNNGLTVEMRNGKVYVSMDESLLFASGSSKIDTKGAEAIKKLAQVLAENPDINVMVEGHTDDVPMKGSGEIKDNWDLSVMRATTVAKLLISSANVNPTRITASGHGEFLPIATGKTPEARKKNRRTEIILTPKLDELFKVIESN